MRCEARFDPPAAPDCAALDRSGHSSIPCGVPRTAVRGDEERGSFRDGCSDAMASDQQLPVVAQDRKRQAVARPESSGIARPFASLQRLSTSPDLEIAQEQIKH